MAVVDHQRRALGADHAPADLERHIVGAPFEDVADLRVAHRRRQHLLEQRDRIAGMAELEAAVVGDLDDALVPAVHAHHRLMDRQRVEEFVGEDDRGAVRHLVEAFVPLHRHTDAADRLALALLERRADLDEMHHDRLPEGGHRLQRTQGVEHHGAAAGAELDQAHVLRRAHQLPGRGRPQPDQLAEHLADLGRGDEVAVGADGIAGDVVAVLGMREAQRHELRDRHRPGGGDAPADFRFEWCDFVRHRLNVSVAAAAPCGPP